MRIERWTSIGPREIAHRGRQEVSKWIDRIVPPAARMPLQEAAPPAAAPAAPPFFAGLDSPLVREMFEGRLGVARAQLLAAARRFAEG
ncbi:MAG TPA: hypothetical protein VFD06_06085, partial [Candidatus Polarisedimenticolia bacterium]|nr:hypothetical protein [Candidatus Polarisedimenticolia bacterium]